MREGNHSDRVIVLNEGESVTEFTIVDKIANTAHCRRQPIFLDFTFKQLLDIVNVKAARGKLEILDLLWIAFLLVVLDSVRCFQRVTDRVQVALMYVLAAADVEAFKSQLNFHLPVIHLDLFA